MMPPARILRTSTLPLALALVLCGVRPASAQFELTWDACAGSPSAHTDKRFECNDDNAMPLKLVIAFTPNVPMNRFVGLQCYLAVSSSGNDLPDWWRMGIGECREGVMTFPASSVGATGMCVNPWMGGNIGGGYQWDRDYFGSGRPRLQLALARDSKVGLSSGQRYLGGVISIETAHSTGGDGASCSGCSAEACITINELDLFQEEEGEVTSSDIVTYTRSSQNAVATFNVTNPGSNPCGSKVVNKTWWQVKSVYRKP